MKQLVPWTLAVLLTGFSSLAFASSTAELNLWKHDPFFYGSCGHCGDFVRFQENKDKSDFTDFNLYNQTGYYSAVLYGPEKTTMTLFGGQSFATDKGFLVIVKKDDTVVQIENLEAFTPGEWTDVEAKQGWSGAYSVYYQPYPQFKNNIASGKWGKWWNSLPSVNPAG
ncbi:MAG: hypothetical protein NPINA01_24170 [Nitrospinaceae bacterium]|nr:MAG: hypothetical protein NPINA01_24170 [Nitrospinaceae bacterium]